MLLNLKNINKIFFNNYKIKFLVNNLIVIIGLIFMSVILKGVLKTVANADIMFSIILWFMFMIIFYTEFSKLFISIFYKRVKSHAYLYMMYSKNKITRDQNFLYKLEFLSLYIFLKFITLSIIIFIISKTLNQYINYGESEWILINSLLGAVLASIFVTYVISMLNSKALTIGANVLMYFCIYISTICSATSGGQIPSDSPIWFEILFHIPLIFNSSPASTGIRDLKFVNFQNLIFSTVLVGILLLLLFYKNRKIEY